jgi:hypothetical protein
MGYHPVGSLSEGDIGQRSGGSDRVIVLHPEVHPTHVDDHDHKRALRREGCTMALYATICLLAALTVAAQDEVSHRGTLLRIIWGTTVGLAIAHFFAFRMTARLFTGGILLRHDAESALIQLLGATAVAGMATLPVLLVDEDAAVEAVRLVLAGVIGVVGFAAAKASGTTHLRAFAIATVTLVAGLAIALVKNALSHH